MPDLIGPLLPLIGILVLFVIAVGVLGFLKSRQRGPAKFPYERENALFSPAERSFLGVLEQAVGEKARVFGKFRLADVIRVKRGVKRPAWQSAFNMISSKHLDFVACNSDDLTIQFAVELDDKSHANAKRQKRDDFLDQALKAAGVPLFRFPAKHAYSVQDIRSRIFQQEREQTEALQPTKADKSGRIEPRF